MKIEITDTGWKEITTKEFKIIGGRWKGSFIDVTTKKWIESNKRIGLPKNRETCKCCHRKWEDLPGKVNFFTTNYGNKAICDECVVKIFAGEKG